MRATDGRPYIEIWFILTVIGYVYFLISLAVTVAAMLIMDRKSFKKADYNLLLTFVLTFFVLLGEWKHHNNSLTTANPMMAPIVLLKISSSSNCPLRKVYCKTSIDDDKIKA